MIFNLGKSLNTLLNESLYFEITFGLCASIPITHLLPILLAISNKEECYFSDVKVGNKDIEIENYVHDGMYETYYVVNFYNRKTHNSCGFSYNPYFRTLDFDSVPEDASVYIKNVGDECMFLRLNPGRIFIKPREQVKYCEKNYIKEDTRILFCYGKEIEKFEIPNA